MKKLTALLLAAVLTLSLCACSRSLRSTEETQGDEGFRNAAKTMEDMQSVAFDAELALTVASGDFSLPLQMQASGESTENPRRVHSHLRAGLDIAALTMEIYTEETEEELLTYTGLNLLGETTWSCLSEPKTETPPLHAARLLDLLARMKPAGEGKTEDGRTGSSYEGIITPENIRRVFHALQMMDTTGQTDDAAREIQDMLEAMDPDAGIPVTAILDPEAGWLLELRVDLTETTRAMLRQEPDMEDVDIPEFSFRVTFRDHNQVEPIQIPEEAQLARELE